MLCMTQDDTYHCVFGAIQGCGRYNIQDGYDYFPLLYWNSQRTTICRYTSLVKAIRLIQRAQAYCSTRMQGNGIGGLNYPTFARRTKW